MPHYQAFDPLAEMNGTTVLSFTKSILSDDIAAILKRYHLDNIDPQAWYPVQNLLDVFSEISESPNASSIFVSIGVAAATKHSSISTYRTPDASGMISGMCETRRRKIPAWMPV